MTSRSRPSAASSRSSGPYNASSITRPGYTVPTSEFLSTVDTIETRTIAFSLCVHVALCDVLEQAYSFFRLTLELYLLLVQGTARVPEEPKQRDADRQYLRLLSTSMKPTEGVLFYGVAVGQKCTSAQVLPRALPWSIVPALVPDRARAR